jgi:hypothetical protein
MEDESKKSKTKVFATEEEFNEYIREKAKKSRKPFDLRRFLGELHHRR